MLHIIRLQQNIPMKGESSMKNKRYNKIRIRLITLLIFMSFFTTTGTFAYFADSVEGSINDSSYVFKIGSLLEISALFSLHSEEDRESYEIPVSEYLSDELEYNTKYEIPFAIRWDDDSVELNEDEMLIGEVELKYYFVVTEDGKEVSSRDYKKISRILKIEFDSNNLNELISGRSPQEMLATFNVKNPNTNQMNVFKDVKIEVVFYYEITNTNIEGVK